MRKFAVVATVAAAFLALHPRRPGLRRPPPEHARRTGQLAGAPVPSNTPTSAPKSRDPWRASPSRRTSTTRSTRKSKRSTSSRCRTKAAVDDMTSSSARATSSA